MHLFNQEGESLTHAIVDPAHEEVDTRFRSGPALRIGVLGTPFSSGNRGVLALGASLYKLCSGIGGGSEVTFFGVGSPGRHVRIRSNGEMRDVRFMNCRMSPKARWNEQILVILVASLVYRICHNQGFRKRLGTAFPWIGELERMDVVGDIRGGDSFSDIYGLGRFLGATLPVISVIMIKGRIVQFPQTYGPYQSRIAKCVARWILKHSSPVLARDTRSQAVAESLVSKATKVELSPDVAFALDPLAVNNPVIDGSDEAAGFDPSQTIGINVNGLMYGGGYTGKNMFGAKLDYPRFLTTFIEQILKEYTGEILLVPHTYAAVGDVESDNGACQVVKGLINPAFRTRVRILTGEYDAHQLKGIIGTLDFFIGSRMHACIAALSQGVPCVGVAYSMKFAGVFESIGAGEWVVEARDLSTEEAVNRTMECWKKSAAFRPELEVQSRRAKERLEKFFARIGHRLSIREELGSAGTSAVFEIDQVP